MVLKSSLLLLCAVFLPSVITDPIITMLKEEIEKKINETMAVDLENSKLERELIELPKEYETKIEKLNLVKQNVSVDYKNELKIIKKLKLDLPQVFEKLTMVKHEIERYNTRHLRTELGLKWVEQFIFNLESRKAEGEDRKCLQLQAGDDIVNATPRQATSGRNDEADLDNVVIELKMVKVKLDKVKAKKDKLTLKLKQKTEFWEQIKEDLVKSVREVEDGFKKASGTVKILQDEVEDTKKQLVNAISELENLRIVIKEDNGRVAKVKKTLEGFAKYTSCYSALEKQVMINI